MGNEAKVKKYMQAAEKIAAMPKLSYGDTRVNGYWDGKGFHKTGHQNPWQIDRKPIGYVACNTFVWYSLSRGGFGGNGALKAAYKSFATTNPKSDGEVETLKKMGFKEYAYHDDESKLRYGDVLWKNGHTAFYYKKGYALSAHVSSTSIEKCVGPEKMKTGYWKKYYRLPQSSPSKVSSIISTAAKMLKNTTATKKPTTSTAKKKAAPAKKKVVKKKVVKKKVAAPAKKKPVVKRKAPVKKPAATAKKK